MSGPPNSAGADRSYDWRIEVHGPEGAPAVVLLHSIATSSAMWSLQLPAWSQRFRIYNVDLPGHGSTPASSDFTFAEAARAVRALLDRAGVESAAVVGLSLGGMIAQAFAVAFPQRLRALVLAHTTARATPAAQQLWDERIAAVESGGMASQVALTLERWFTERFRRDAPLTVAWIEALIRGTSPAGFMAAARAIRGLDHLDALATVRAPALIVAGNADPGAPPSAARAMQDRLKRSELECLDCAHLGNVEQAYRFTEIVGRFLVRTS